MGDKKGANNHDSLPSSTEITIIPSIPNVVITPPDPGTDIYSMPPGTAVIPVAIGGASLTCIRDEASGMMCESDGSEASASFVPTSAFYATEVEKMWIQTTFIAMDQGKFAVAIPDALKKTQISVSIMLVDAANKSMADMRVDTHQPLINLVKDGSFEEFAIDPKAIEDSRVIRPENQTHWKASRTNDEDAGLCLPLIELESELVHPEVSAIHGKQWMELSSRCDVAAEAPRKNLAISQELALEAGQTYYVSFAYRTPSSLTSYQQMRVLFNGKSVIALGNESSEWRYLSFLVTSDQDTTQLTFEEVNENPGRGMNIDNVQIVNVSALEAK